MTKYSGPCRRLKDRFAVHSIVWGAEGWKVKGLRFTYCMIQFSLLVLSSILGNLRLTFESVLGEKYTK